jgi:hypothetical protein
VLIGLLAGLLCLLSRVLAGLLTLLRWLGALPSLLRLALVILVHANLQNSRNIISMHIKLPHVSMRDVPEKTVSPTDIFLLK